MSFQHLLDAALGNDAHEPQHATRTNVRQNHQQPRQHHNYKRRPSPAGHDFDSDGVVTISATDGLALNKDELHEWLQRQIVDAILEAGLLVHVSVRCFVVPPLPRRAYFPSCYDICVNE